MNLSKENLKNITADNIIVPSAEMLELPEKVLQFGTGVLLRGLPDYFIDKANREGIFNGRIVVVKSTATGSSTEFEDQDGLYTLHVKGIEKGEKIEEDIICSAISRVVSASSDWSEVLKCAQNPAMGIVISNTTEVGIQLVEDDITQSPPVSFPGKLLAFLYERYKAFSGSPECGVVIVPTELIVDNGIKLKAIVLELASQNKLEAQFVNWLENHNSFCNSLVDRIVPGKPDAKTYAALEDQSPYQDGLRIVSEVYRLWAIQGDDHVASVLSFAKADKGVIIARDIEIYRELKLRMLNGTHTLSCAVAFLSGFKTVKNAMDNENMSSFISSTMQQDIAPAIPYDITEQQSLEFSNSVLDRFSNPHIEHLWHSISLSYSAKLKMRVLPVLLNSYKKSSSIPENIAFGFAAYILFMKSVKQEGNDYYGQLNNEFYKINDDKALVFAKAWENPETASMVKSILSDVSLWDTDLTTLTGFAEAVTDSLKAIQQDGALKALTAKQNKISA